MNQLIVTDWSSSWSIVIAKKTLNIYKQLLDSSFASEGYIGLWFRRVLTAADKDQFDCDTLFTEHVAGNGLVTEAGVDITLEWD